ncbi:MAG: hypothetical protein K6B41_10390 [Butyrivibrio sp.]|nr:hypothetical protein [Butyrivibrio sp.]
MTLGENLHNAFDVVFKTMQSIEKLILKLQNEIDDECYYKPTERFLRYGSEKDYRGWVNWSFILLYQRKADGDIMGNGWINAPVYAVEINVDPENTTEPIIYIARYNFGDTSTWASGVSPASHNIFYNPLHAQYYFVEKKLDDSTTIIMYKDGLPDKVKSAFWNLKYVYRKELKLANINAGNYKAQIFSAIEDLSKLK